MNQYFAVKEYISALCVLCALGAAGPSYAQAGSLTTRVPDVDGIMRQPLANTGQRAVVLFFVTNDCPITNSYAPEMERICKQYKSLGVRFYAVYVDPSVSAADARKHARTFGLTCTALCDTRHDLVKYCSATVMPEAAVVLPNGKTAYLGRIDDRYIDFGKSRYHANTHDLRDAIKAILNNKLPATPQTKAVGCYIPPLQ